LTAAFALLLGTNPDGNLVRLDVRYGYPLAAIGSRRLMSFLPALYRPVAPFSSPTVPVNPPQDTVAVLIRAVFTWAEQNLAEGSGREFVIGVAAFSTLDAATPKPLIELRQLEYPEAIGPGDRPEQCGI
jgi:hypothetical protein